LQLLSCTWGDDVEVYGVSKNYIADVPIGRDFRMYISTTFWRTF
jgi:hypothetical protein